MLPNRMLEVMAVGAWYYSMLGTSLLGIYLIRLLFYSYYWPLILCYLIWIYFDRNTPMTHGRSISFIRKNFFWYYFRSYFPQTLIKTADLDPKENYILALYPHGIFASSAFANFFSGNSDFYGLFPGINVTPLTLTLNFYIPIYRELILSSGVCSCDRKSIMYRLNQPGGEAVLLVPGGAAEALITEKGAYRIILKNRKGFIKLAHEAGASVVPVVAFGETNAYDHVNFDRDSFIYKFQQRLKKAIGVAPCLAWGRSMLFQFGLLPYRTPVTTVVGKPIKLKKVKDPSKDLINESHEKFIYEINNIFETYKHKYIPNPDSIHLILED